MKKSSREEKRENIRELIVGVMPPGRWVTCGDIVNRARTGGVDTSRWSVPLIAGLLVAEIARGRVTKGFAPDRTAIYMRRVDEDV